MNTQISRNSLLGLIVAYPCTDKKYFLAKFIQTQLRLRCITTSRKWRHVHFLFPPHLCCVCFLPALFHSFLGSQSGLLRAFLFGHGLQAILTVLGLDCLSGVALWTSLAPYSDPLTVSFPFLRPFPQISAPQRLSEYMLGCQRFWMNGLAGDE